MDENYRRWYSRKDVQSSAMAFAPLLKYTGLARECALLIPPMKVEFGELPSRACRNTILYKFDNLLSMAKSFEKFSILVSLEKFRYVDNGITLPFTEAAANFSNPDFYHSHIAACDFIADIDFKIPEFHKNKECMDEVRRTWDVMLGIFGSRSLFVKYSGNRGFHFYVNYETFSNDNILPLFPRFGRVIASKIKEEAKAPNIDLKIYGNRRLWRLPGSLHEFTSRVSTPIIKDDLDKFNPDDYSLANMIKKEDGTLPTWDIKNYRRSSKADEFIKSCIKDNKS